MVLLEMIDRGLREEGIGLKYENKEATKLGD